MSTTDKLFALRPVVLSLALAFACGCASHNYPQRILRTATNVPERFMTLGQKTAPVGLCHSPMVDPRDGTEISLHRSVAGVGDYKVPPGRYGVGDRELLRLDCRSGKAMGVVSR